MKYAIINDEGTEVLRYLKKSPVKDGTLPQLKERNVLPVEETRPELQPWEQLGVRNESVESDKVSVTYDVNSLSLDEYKKKVIQYVLFDARQLLQKQLDPIEQYPSVYKALPQARKNAMDAVAQNIVTQVIAKQDAIKSATTHEEVSQIDLTLTEE